MKLLHRLAPSLLWSVGIVLLMLAGFYAGSLASVAGAHDMDLHEAGFDDHLHEADEGFSLSTNLSLESVFAGPACPSDAPARVYDVVAINVEMTLNRYLDYDPLGRMYVLTEELDRVRAEEAQNRAARAGTAEPAVSIGLQGDAIQPLTLRVNQGECLRINLRNGLADGSQASLHLHASGLRIASTGAPALATNPDALAAPGATVTYEWWVRPEEPEGTHMFHSHGDAREQTNHGMFGAVVVEPAGSSFINATTGQQLRSGWDATIVDPSGSHFREFAIYYHEVGNERYRHLDRNGRQVIQVDPFTSAYRPGDRAMNYRSEPFMNRLALQQQTIGAFDKSAPYSSYAFGDPATPIARSYLGDPVKQRVIHGGSEVFHVHHVHGGSIRWSRQPGVETRPFDVGLAKHPPLIPQASERIDAQSIGPSETFDITDECGSGGCQLGAGDYLIHCHVAHHYLAGMWMIWRVYDTLQTAGNSQDGLPPLLELPDRPGQLQPAVTSEELIGRTVSWQGQTFDITADNLGEWVERQLPPAGVAKGYDASVLDWQRDGSLYLGEIETDQVWPGYVSAQPGERPSIPFDPVSGKLAYPWLRPHLGQRPPFAPNHGPAPFLEPMHPGTTPAEPGANGPWSLCPTGTQPRSFAINAINLPIALNQRTNQLDPVGALFVLRDQEEAVRASNDLRTPLAIRANAGEDCVDVLLRSEIEDSRENVFLSKVDIHIHFAQFDVQASDGVDTGFNYEQSVRPFAKEGERLPDQVAVGATTLRVGSADRFQPGVVVGVGMDQDGTFESARIVAVDGDILTFDAPLQFSHNAGEIVSTEFVRYRWYPDVQFGTAYFHDHVDALHSWRHGLFGAFISEPPGSTYHDPRTGAELRSGPVADIHTDGRVSVDVLGSFRELLMFIQDDNPITHLGNAAGGTFNLRAEAPASRGGDPSRYFSSVEHGDPVTPVFEALVGDPLVFRSLVAGTNEVHTWHLDGHWFRIEPYSSTSPPTNTVHLGISERFDLVVPRAGGPQGLPGDYLFYNGRASKLREGLWGLLRVGDGSESAIQRLPGHDSIAASPPPVCPPGAPPKTFGVAAVDLPLPMLASGTGKAYVLAEDIDSIRAGTKVVEPLVLHVNVGDCIVVDLQNVTSGPVTFHADMLALDPRQSQGVDAGQNPAQTIASGESARYTLYAHPEVGETTALVRDWGNVLVNPARGLYGAIVVGPAGATYTDPITGSTFPTITRLSARSVAWRSSSRMRRPCWIRRLACSRPC